MKATKQSWSEVGPRPAQENKLLMFLLCYCNVTDTDVILQDKEWFAGECNRKIAEDLLLRINKVNRHFLFVAFFFWSVLLKFFWIPPLFLIAGWCLSHPTQLRPEHLAAVHTRCALPAEGVQYSHPLLGGDTGLCPRERGQEEWRGERKVCRRGTEWRRPLI